MTVRGRGSFHHWQTFIGSRRLWEYSHDCIHEWRCVPTQGSLFIGWMEYSLAVLWANNPHHSTCPYALYFKFHHLHLTRNSFSSPISRISSILINDVWIISSETDDCELWLERNQTYADTSSAMSCHILSFCLAVSVGDSLPNSWS